MYEYLQVMPMQAPRPVIGASVEILTASMDGNQNQTVITAVQQTQANNVVLPTETLFIRHTKLNINLVETKFFLYMSWLH